MAAPFRLVSTTRSGSCVVALALIAACGGGDDSRGQTDAAAAQTDVAVVDTARPADVAAASDTGGGDVSVPLDAAAVDTATGTWPPAPPWHTGKQCALPACDPAAAETVDLSGTWTQTLTTVSHTCNSLVATMDPRMQPGHVETATISSPRAGECVYLDAVGGTIIGVIKDAVMITCEVYAAQQGVTPVVESQVEFSGDTASGQAWTYLFDVPLPPSECQATYTVTMERQ